MAEEEWGCPECEVVATRRHNLVRHLVGAHGMEQAVADAVAGDPSTAPVREASGNRPVTSGHRRSLALLEDIDAVGKTVAAFNDALDRVRILLRPADAGLTVMSLDSDRCASMISVGAAGGGGTLTSLPPSPDRLASMVEAYVDKRDRLARGSDEELFSLRLIAGSFDNGLRLAASGWIFVAHEWRVHLSNGSNGKVDLLGFDPASRRLVVIELKASRHEVAKPDPNGWDAARQADEYAAAIWRDRAELYPFFDRLIAAQLRAHAPEVAVEPIDVEKPPTTAVWYPHPDGDHTPAWPAWNSAELAVRSDSDRMAKYRRHQSWYREAILGVAPGDHPKVAGRRIGNMLERSAVEAKSDLNFVNDAAYRHAVRRAVFDGEAESVDRVVCEAPSPPTRGDRTAFDAQVDYVSAGGEARFLAIETKYTEPFTQTQFDREEYRTIAEQCGWFRPAAADALVEVETNQLWRGLLLMSVTEAHRSAVGRYVVVAADDDSDARAAAEAVTSWMSPNEQWRLQFRSIEEIVTAAPRVGDSAIAAWADAFAQRYLVAAD